MTILSLNFKYLYLSYLYLNASGRPSRTTLISVHDWIHGHFNDITPQNTALMFVVEVQVFILWHIKILSILSFELLLKDFTHSCHFTFKRIVSYISNYEFCWRFLWFQDIHRALMSMNSLVSNMMRLLAKSFPTFATLIRFFSSVDSRM